MWENCLLLICVQVSAVAVTEVWFLEKLLFYIFKVWVPYRFSSPIPWLLLLSLLLCEHVLNYALSDLYRNMLSSLISEFPHDKRWRESVADTHTVPLPQRQQATQAHCPAPNRPPSQSATRTSIAVCLCSEPRTQVLGDFEINLDLANVRGDFVVK